jgi:hypothetical protein
VGRNSNSDGPGGRWDNLQTEKGDNLSNKKPKKKTEWIVSPPRQK